MILFFLLIVANLKNVFLLVATCAVLGGMIVCRIHSSAQYSQKYLFYITYFFRKSFVNLWEVKAPKYSVYILHWAYMFSKIMKGVRWQKYADFDYIETTQGVFHIRPYTFDAICVSPDYERPDIDAMIQFIKEQQQHNRSVLMVDVGANIGSYSVRIGNAFRTWKDFSIIAFEPFSSSFSLIIEEKVDIRNVALYSHEGTAPLYLNSLDPGSNSFFKNNQHNFPTQAGVKTICMDDLDDDCIGNQAGVVIIKLDVEGSEVAVLRGAQKILHSHRKILLMVEVFVDPTVCQYLIATGWHRALKKTPYNSFWTR